MSPHSFKLIHSGVKIIFFFILYLQSHSLWGKFVLSQSLLFEYQVIEKNLYYFQGTKKNEFQNSPSQAEDSQYQQNYRIKSRTGYQHQYFAVLFDYIYSYHEFNYFNRLKSKVDPETKIQQIHAIKPHLFGQFNPFRIGLSYLYHFTSPPLRESAWSILPDRALSFYFQFYLAELWQEAPIGLSARYQIAILPHLTTSKIKQNLFHQLSLGFHINFNYYGQFEILMSYVERKGNFYFYKLSDGQEKNHFRNSINRYYTDFIYTFQLVKELSIMFGVGKMVYSEHEPPMMRFLFGVTYFFIH